MRRERAGLLLGLLLGIACNSTQTTAGQFTVSGTVQGLDGTLVLHTGTENLLISNDGLFQFARTFSTNESYVVSLVTQPDTQTCAISNGVGVVSTRNVTNVEVVCGGLNGGATGSSTGGTTGGGSAGGTTGPRSDGFAVGGEVHGLRKSGQLVLQTSSQLSIDTVTVNKNGTFSFVSRQAFGADYSVTVLQQPFNQVCTVQGGDGTVSTNDVVSIQVFCMYSVGGRVQGLSGAVQIVNSASDGSAAVVTTAQDGTFAFPIAYDANTTYRVSVLTQPTGQKCVVENPNGVVGNANIYTVAVNCPPGFYAVGGSISPVGSTPTLQLNGVTSLQVLPTQRTFTFNPNNVQAQTSYAVTVKAQPAGQQCGVRQSSTLMPSRDVSDVVVNCNNFAGAYPVGGKIIGVNAGYVTLTNGADVQVTANGNYTMQKLVSPGSAYGLLIHQPPPYQACEFMNPANANGTMGNAPVSTIDVRCIPFLTFVPAQEANSVVGQFDFNRTSAQTANANTLKSPQGEAALDGNRKLYIADMQNNRVLGYNSIPARNNARADFVLGQASLTSTTGSVGNASYHAPSAVSSDGSRVVVTDMGNNRVLVYPAGHDGVRMPGPMQVVGQADAQSNVSGCTGTNFTQPTRARLVGNRLVVADSGNNRVLIWSTVPLDASTPANYVLGQPAANTCLPNQGNGAPSSHTLWEPQGIHSDGTALFIADTKNNRVLVWSDIGSITGSNQPANYVLGQAVFSSNTAGCAAASMGRPASLSFDGTQLYVADSNNSRVLLFDTTSLSNGMAATALLGQQDFDHCNCNTSGANVLCRPEGVAILGPRLAVSDTGNNRVLVFNAY